MKDGGSVGSNMGPEQGDLRDLFADLLQQCGDSAYNTAFRLAGNEQDARDLVQQAFLKALEHLDQYDPSRPFKPYLMKILHHLYLDSLRRYDRKHVVSLNAETPSEGSSWEEILPSHALTPLEELSQKEVEHLVQ